MSELAICNLTPDISIRDGRAVTTSIAVAEFFHKTHDNVLKKIRSVISECNAPYRLVNFNETSYQRENPNGGIGITTPMYELTRDAFVLIVMGFTGKKALQWKIDYINAFNKMEEQLHQRPAELPVNNFSGRVVLSIENGQLRSARHLKDRDFVGSLESFIELAGEAGCLVIRGSDLADLIKARRVAWPVLDIPDKAG